MLINELFQKINEGIHDKYQGKVIFVLGSPGSGKDYMIKKLIPDSANFKTMDLDYIVHQLKKTPVKEKIDNAFKEYQKNKEKFGNESNNEIETASVPSTIKKVEYHGRPYTYDDFFYSESWEALLRKQNLLTNELLMPIISNQTGRKITSLSKQITDLKKIGYDIFILFVYSTEENAYARTANREIKGSGKDARKVDYDYFKSAYIGSITTLEKIKSAISTENVSEIQDNNLKNIALMVDGFDVVENYSIDADHEKTIPSHLLNYYRELENKAKKDILSFLNKPASEDFYKNLKKALDPTDIVAEKLVNIAISKGKKFPLYSTYDELINHASEQIKSKYNGIKSNNLQLKKTRTNQDIIHTIRHGNVAKLNQLLQKTNINDINIRDTLETAVRTNINDQQISKILVKFINTNGSEDQKQLTKEILGKKYPYFF